MKRRVVLALPCLAASWAWAHADEPSSLAKFVASMKLSPTWERIEFEEKGPAKYQLTLHYKPKVTVTRAGPEADTKQITRAVLAELVKQGRKPADEHLGLDVFAQQSMVGETGKKLVRIFGFTSYDYHIDQLEFTRMGK